jgi:hypothetical protein
MWLDRYDFDPTFCDSLYSKATLWNHSEYTTVRLSSNGLGWIASVPYQKCHSQRYALHNFQRYWICISEYTTGSYINKISV